MKTAGRRQLVVRPVPSPIPARGHDANFVRTASAAVQLLRQMPEAHLRQRAVKLNQIFGGDDDLVPALFAPDPMMAAIRGRTANGGLSPIIALRHRFAAHDHVRILFHNCGTVNSGAPGCGIPDA